MMYKDETLDPPAIMCIVGSTKLMYDMRAINDLHAMLKTHGDWMPLGSADEQKPAAEGTVEAWGRSAENPVGRWRSYTYDELLARDKVSLDIFWLRDESLADSANLPDPDVLAQEIMEDLQAALEQFAQIAEDLRE